MSESREGTLSTTAAKSPRSEPNHQWAKFYAQACTLLASTNDKFKQEEKNGEAKEKGRSADGSASGSSSDEEMTKLHQRIMITLDTITKLIFGLSATRKAQVVVHGGGAIELVVGLVRGSKVLEDTNSTALAKPIVLSSLKAIKTSVLRNPAARCRCRSAGVFSFLKDILDAILKGVDKEDKDAEDKMLVEQVFTALAAICLGDDLNALQASTQFKPLMEKTKSVYCHEGDDHESSLDQKLEYLEKLFITIDKEQSDLLSYLEKNNTKHEHGKSSYEIFTQNVNEAEVNIRSGYTSLQAGKYEQAEDQYSLSLKLITPYIDHTKLLDPLMIETRTKRGQCNYEMDKVENCLMDTMYLLEQERLGESAPMVSVNVLKLHSKVLMKVGRSDEAKETLGKLAILCPEDEEVVQMMQDLGLK